VSQPVQLSPETIACLRDEAYVYLCRQSLTQELTRVEIERADVEKTKPSFALFASKQSRLAYQRAMDAVLEAEGVIRQKLVPVERLEHTLRSELENALNEHLRLTDPEPQIFDEICALVDRWQSSVASLGEHALAFARDNRAAAKVEPGRSPDAEAVATFRSSAAYLHAAAAKIDLITEEAARLGEGRLPPGTRLPQLPPFRPSTWVDKTFLLAPENCTAELQAAELEARAFCNSGKNDLLVAAETTRAAALRARQSFLDAHWSLLRAHALKHYVKPREVDEVIAELSARYLTSDLDHYQIEQAKNPFIV
jgi:hypothetical protein